MKYKLNCIFNQRNMTWLYWYEDARGNRVTIYRDNATDAFYQLTQHLLGLQELPEVIVIDSSSCEEAENF